MQVRLLLAQSNLIVYYVRRYRFWHYKSKIVYVGTSFCRAINELQIQKTVFYTIEQDNSTFEYRCFDYWGEIKS